MDNSAANDQTGEAPHHFKAETSQILDILIHSLYTEREIFLRELVSNASDALTRLDFEILTNRDILDPELELAIHISFDEKEKTLTIEDSGIGMTADELITNLGTIAQSGAREFIKAAKERESNVSELIGQFGVGFYSAFMVAEWVRVTSRSYRKDAPAATWFSGGSDTFTVQQAEKQNRGTAVTIKLKQDAEEYLNQNRLREIIRRHSDFIPFPIYLSGQTEQVNRQTAIWRQQPRDVEAKDYEEFYRQLTYDFEAPLTHTHMVVDAPAQMYAILYIPANPEQGLFPVPRRDGLKLYARKVLIEESNQDLLPEYLRFVQGVVDSEDLPLNVSREAVQSTKVITHLKKLITSKIIDVLVKLAEDDPQKYGQFWESYRMYIKQGIAIEPQQAEMLYPLLRFKTTLNVTEWSSLEDYLARKKPDQSEIFYIIGDDNQSVLYSPHLDLPRSRGYEVMLLTDPVDAFMLVKLSSYKEHQLVNVAAAEFDLPSVEDEEAHLPHLENTAQVSLVERFKKILGDKVADVRMTERLSTSPARLVDLEGGIKQEMQRVYRLIDKEFNMPKKVLELNPAHPILIGMANLEDDDPLNSLVIEQIFEDALLIEGLLPDPAGMIGRIQQLMEAAVKAPDNN